MRRKYQAGYTVEAAYVMTIVILAMVILLRTAYEQCQETTAYMKLHQVVYQLRGQEEEYDKDFAAGQWKGSVRRENDQVWGSADHNDEQLEIEMQIHDPEGMMRRLTIVQSQKQEKKNGQYKADGDQLSSGDEK